MTIRDIEDNYVTYLDDALGYSFGAWDIVSSKDRALHDRVLAAELSEISNLDREGLSGIVLWAIARRQSESLATLDAFEEMVGELVKSEDPCLDHLEIATFTMRHLLRLGQNDRAERLLTTLEPLEGNKELWKGLLTRNTDPTASRDSLTIWIDKDSLPIEATLDVVENLIHFGDYETASFWLEEAANRSSDSNYSPALVDIELFRTLIQDKR